MHDELKTILTRTASPILGEEDIEFYSYGLMAMLQGQQKLNRIPDMQFKRKFTVLFRLYEPLVHACYDQPPKLLDAFFLWENNFFAKIPLVHHRDQAREENMNDIAELAYSDPDEVEEIVLERADKLNEKMEQQRIKAEEAKRKRLANAKPKKQSNAFQWDGDESQVVLNCSMAVRGLSRDLIDSITETATALQKREGEATEQPHVEQVCTKAAIGRLAENTAFLMKQAEAIGVDVHKIEDEAVALPDGDEQTWCQEFPHLRNLSALQNNCQYLDPQESSTALKAIRFASAMVQREQSKLSAREKSVTTAPQAKVFVGFLSAWKTRLDEERQAIEDDWQSEREEMLNIERKEKFAKYIGKLKQKTKTINLEGDIDNLFSVQTKFKSAVKKSMAISMMSAMKPKAAAPDMKQIMQQQREQSGADE